MSLLEGTCCPTQSFKAILDQSEADAMKPVDDIMVSSDTEKAGALPPQVYHPLKLSIPSSAGVKENALARATSTYWVHGAPTVLVVAASSSRSRPNSPTKPSSSAKQWMLYLPIALGCLFVYLFSNISPLFLPNSCRSLVVLSSFHNYFVCLFCIK